jgi:hypothetical protein
LLVARLRLKKEKPPPCPVRVVPYKAPGGDLLLHGKATLPSAHARFTSEFGMGSGGTTPLWPPGKGLKQRMTRRLQSGLSPLEESAMDGGLCLFAKRTRVK